MALIPWQFCPRGSFTGELCIGKDHTSDSKFCNTHLELSCTHALHDHLLYAFVEHIDPLWNSEHALSSKFEMHSTLCFYTISQNLTILNAYGLNRYRLDHFYLVKWVRFLNGRLQYYNLFFFATLVSIVWLSGYSVCWIFKSSCVRLLTWAHRFLEGEGTISFTITF